MIASNSKSVNNSMSLVQKKASTSKNTTETKKRHPKKVTTGDGSSSIKYINNSDIVTQLGNALVREYLSRHGCKKSLSSLTETDEKELSENSKKVYNSRTELARSLGILKQAQQNKNSKTVYLSLLEVIINAVLLDSTNHNKDEKGNNKSSSNSISKEKEKTSHISKHKEADKSNYPYTSSSSSNGEHQQQHSEHESRKVKVVNPSSSSSSNSHSSQLTSGITISVAKASPAISSYSFPFSKNNTTMLGNKPKLMNGNNDIFDKNKNNINIINSSSSISNSNSNNNNHNHNNNNSHSESNPIKKGNHSHGNHSHSHDIGRDTMFSSPISFTTNGDSNGFIKPKRNSNPTVNHSMAVQEDDMLIEDIQLQDFDMPINDITISNNRHSSHGNSSGLNIWKNQGKPISNETSKDLLKLVFGDTKENYQDSWKGKRFIFNKNQNVSYGLIQEKGGPCGLISVVQAYIILHLVFKNTQYENVDEDMLHTFSEDEKEDALINSLADIIWKSGEWNNSCTIVLPSPNSLSKNLAENLILYKVYSRDACRNFISQNLSQIQTHSFLLLLYSTILSRGIDNVRNDMDEPNNTLIGMHGYCTQDLVNLLITGKATSNVHDNDIRLGDDNAPDDECKILKGIKTQPNIGHLSLFEHYRSIIVGSYYKNPKYPIFIVCSESHYTVLFSLDKDVVSTKRNISMFDLFYYDQLSNQQEEIKLTLTLLNDGYEGGEDDNNGDEIIDHHEKLVPPLNLCIKTKWKNVNIDWNNTDPLL
ncbi:hypothetical protein H8356DRAFT_1298013 [Neocallimastix lanati (nom. inval.)]|nr:hypothetical protein H8356DRAFT_1298013 [Neocallimastix sp. JGI-2020a]